MLKTEAKSAPNAYLTYLRSKYGRLSVLFVVSVLIVTLTGVFSYTRGGVQAATSSTLNFQARLLSNTGALVADGTYNIEFNLYTVSAGGTTQWTETHTNSGTNPITLKYGYLSVNLGDSTTGTVFPSTINWDQEQWLGMTVRGTGSCAFGACTPTDSEMSPRFKLTAVPYAFKAGTALGVSSNPTSTASTNSNTVAITTGNATGTTSNSGNLTLDTGTATQTTGTITLGATSASALTLGRSGLTTTNAGALTVAQLLTGQLGLTVTGAAVSLNDSSNFATSINGGTSSGNVTINGGTSTGTTTLGNSASLVSVLGVIQGSSPFTFEGATADAFETIFAITDPTVGDKTITFPNETGTVCTTGSVCTGYQAAVTGGAANQQLSNLSGTVAINLSLTIVIADV